MIDWITKFVDTLPTQTKALLLVLAFVGSGAYVWTYLRPNVIIAPVQAQVSDLRVITDNNGRRLDNIIVRFDARGEMLENVQRWMCFQNRIDAIKSGIRCAELGVLKE